MVDILMATYNGEKYLSQQLDSILNQTFKDFRILIRDDGSKDDTVNLIKAYQNKYKNKIFLIDKKTDTKNPASNFIELAKCATSDYAMYCDQDDYWLPEKIEKSINKMRYIESEVSNNKPILVFTDYTISDKRLNKLYAKSKIHKKNLKINNILVQNYIPGFSMMINKYLYKLIGDYNNSILMHDWWTAMIASAIGIIDYVEEPVVIYRQHDNNFVGYRNLKSFQYRFRKILNSETKNSQKLYQDQAKLFLDRYENYLDPYCYKKISDFVEIGSKKSKFNRVKSLISGRYLKGDLIRIVGQIIYI